jgi:hypothetical protein
MTWIFELGKIAALWKSVTMSCSLEKQECFADAALSNAISDEGEGENDMRVSVIAGRHC